VSRSPLALAPDVPGCATTAPISLAHTITILPVVFALIKLEDALVPRRPALFTLAALHNKNLKQWFCPTISNMMKFASLIGRFAYRSLRLSVASLIGRFAYRSLRLSVASLIGRFAFCSTFLKVDKNG
jgi:hypothetical protein